MKKREDGLFTTIAIIVGIIIGSGFLKWQYLYIYWVEV